MTNQTDPIRKSSLPCTPPAEWEFVSVNGGQPGGPGVLLIPGDDCGPVVVRRRVSYGDWEPVRPDRWADEQPTDARAVSSAGRAPATDRTALRDQVAATLREHYLHTNRDEADADGNLPCRCGDWREPGAETDDENDWDSHLADAALAMLPVPADRTAVTASELAHALDNSTPYPIEIHSEVCRFMAERLLEMLTIGKRPEHDVWQPEEEPEPGEQPQPQDPAELRRLADEAAVPDQTSDEAHRCGNCAGIDPDTCLMNPDRPKPVTVHAIPLPGSNGISACCGRPPCEFVGERVTRDPDEVTCPGPAVGGAQQPKTIRCDIAVMHQPHPAHDWTQRPDGPVRYCPGVAQPKETGA